MSSDQVNQSIYVAVPMNDTPNDSMHFHDTDSAIAPKSATKTFIKAAVILSIGYFASTLCWVTLPRREPVEIQHRRSFLRKFVPPPPLEEESPYDHTIRPRYYLRKFVHPPPLLEESRDDMPHRNRRWKNVSRDGILRSSSGSTSRDLFGRWYARNNSSDGMMRGVNQDDSRSLESEESSDAYSEEDLRGGYSTEDLQSVYISVLSRERARTSA
ncbi:hypothetical protein HJC23_013171 [Cyclotella cryptica]|uniref:Transmembrane protein n=1 Tax=Cyclotella cryptica TaxID=29204 RepID=A0ABD3QQ12_9STRA|eukprot:CCRYP_003995-RA/>CCRYP_003995-RA protein AED:0.24 eAED:0.24 QI:0/-1/0/1/-1/1/1/0/213